MTDLVADWNSSLDSTKQMVEEWNAKLVQEYRENKLSPQALMAAVEPLPKMLDAPSIGWSRNWRSNWGWSSLTRASEEGVWLSYDHPDMSASRKAFQDMIQNDHVHPGLILNFDQMWRNSWATSKFKLFMKPRSGGWQASTEREERTA